MSILPLFSTISHYFKYYKRHFSPHFHHFYTKTTRLRSFLYQNHPFFVIFISKSPSKPRFSPSKPPNSPINPPPGPPVLGPVYLDRLHRRPRFRRLLERVQPPLWRGAVPAAAVGRGDVRTVGQDRHSQRMEVRVGVILMEFME
jgi:hypothetical protein